MYDEDRNRYEQESGRERVLVVQPRRLGRAMRPVPSHVNFTNETQQRGKEARPK